MVKEDNTLMTTENSSLPQVPPELQDNVRLMPWDKLYNWSRKRSMWPLFTGLACCAIEFIAAAASRFDMGRFGMDIARASPRQADLFVISGTMTKKMAPQVVRLYNQMAEPKYVIALGACAVSGGPFKDGYNVISGVDKFLPVDVYVPGCPPRPEALYNAILTLHAKITNEPISSLRWYQKGGEDEGIPVPVLGPDMVDWRLMYEVPPLERSK
jgi:NADH-quinone oxidoreductase subunit B